MPVSGDTLLRAVRALPLPMPASPCVVGVDEWALRKERTDGTIVIDLERRHVLDRLADRSTGTLAAWLREHPGITVVARDRASEYARAVSLGAEHATEEATHGA
ncbi:transposase [Azospirillum canadense]|nr:transposase [Azospirillum canadense]